MAQHNDHDSEGTEDISVGIAVRYVEGGVQVLPFGGDDYNGIHLEFVDHKQTPPADDEWGLDDDTDFGLKISIANLDPDTAAQLMIAAAQFIQDSDWEEVESD